MRILFTCLLLSFGLLASAQDTSIQKKDGKETARLAFETGEFAIVGGAKLDLNGFFFYGRYIIGMNNIRSAAELSNNLADQSTWKTRQWQLGVGFSLFNF